MLSNISPVLVWIILATMMGSIVSLLLTTLILFLPQRTLTSLISPLVSFASGALLSTALLHILPEALENLRIETAMAFLLSGFFVFFLLEKWILWHHCHSDECEIAGMAGPLILVGDSIHNFLDGVFISAAFLIAFPVGITTTLAVFSHEIPQELGDLAILLEWKNDKRKVFLYNLFSSFSAFVGAFVGFFALSWFQPAVAFLLVLASSSFLYISLTDIFPKLHHRVGLRSSLLQLGFIFLGVASIQIFSRLTH